MIFNCTNISFKNVTVSGSEGIGLSVFNTAGRNVFHKCIFKFNGKLNVRSGTGLKLEISNYNETYQHIENSIYIIENCNFTGNIAYEDSEVLDSPLGRGGGLTIHVRYESCKNTILITGCYFFNNSASKLGGGLYSYFLDNTVGNSLTLSNSVFEENSSPSGYGGAYSLGFDRQTESHNCTNNTIQVDACLFQNNTALYGGGLSFTSTQNHNRTSYNKMRHRNCTWTNNSAHYGAAIVLLPNSWTVHKTGSFMSPIFEDCNILNNHVMENDIVEHRKLNEPFHQSTMGAGVLYCTLIDIQFRGTLIMENNGASAILGSSCSLNFIIGSTAIFTGNSGYAGGAIYLTGHSTIFVNEGNSFVFRNNTAQTDGGAIYHQSSDIIEHAHSYTCFISRSEDADKNTVKFEFAGNLAGVGNGERGHGNSIHVTSLQPCIREYNSSLNGLANFSGNIRDHNEMVSEVSSFSSAPSNNISVDNLPIIPGKYTHLDFEGLDDRFEERSAVYIVTVENKRNGNVISDELSSFAINNSIKLLGNPGDEATVHLSTLTKQKTVLSFSIKLSPCPPGYVLRILQNNSSGCVCSSDTNTRYSGINSCDTLHFTAKKNRGYWAGYDESVSIYSDSSFVTGYCPIGYCKYSSHQLPEEASREILNDNVCNRGREGVLCSKCERNKSVYFHSTHFKCGKQDLCHLGLLFYLASEILPVTVSFLVIIMANVSFTSGSLNGFILYAQVIGFFQMRINNRIELPWCIKNVYETIHMFYEIFNLQFFNINLLSFCIFKNATILDLLMFQYTTVFFSFLLVLLILLVFKTCNVRPIKSFFRCRVHSLKASIVHGLSAFLVLCFAKCAHVSTIVLSYGWIRGKGEKMVKTVVYVYGEYDWFSLDHFKYVIPSVIIGVVIVVIPLVILLSYPVCFKCLAALGVRERKCTLFLCKPIEKLVPFLDSFQGCFKDNCRFFAGLYFLYRILILLNNSLTLTYYFYILLEVQLILMLLVHGIVQPYKKRSHNLIDSLLFANMAIINGISMFNYSQSFSPQLFLNNLQVSFVIQEILMLLPLLCIVLYYALYPVAKRCLKLRLKRRENLVDDLLEYCELPSARSQKRPIKKSGTAAAYNTFGNHNMHS